MKGKTLCISSLVRYRKDLRERLHYLQPLNNFFVGVRDIYCYVLSLMLAKTLIDDGTLLTRSILII